MKEIWCTSFKLFVQNLNRYKWFIIGVIIYLLYFMIFHSNEPNCLIKRTIGFPCPLCGMTRSVLSLLTLQFRDAFMYHPFIVFMPLLFILFMFRGVKKIDFLFNSVYFWIIIFVFYIGIYITRMILFFPDDIPMDYYYDAVFTILH